MNNLIPEISPRELKSLLDRKEAVTLIDVRKASEKQIADLGGALIPIDEIETRLAEVPKTGRVVVYCRSGNRSGRVVQALRQSHGYTNLLNLAGGTLRWSDEIDPTMPKY